MIKYLAIKYNIILLLMKTLYLIFLLFSKTKNHEEIYHKMINYNGNKGCIEATMNMKKAKRLNADKGKCYQFNCKKYQGEKFIPYIGKIKGYKC